MKDDSHVTGDDLDRMVNEADSNTDPVIKKVIDQINPHWRLL
jgi:hypothetical protein